MGGMTSLYRCKDIISFCPSETESRYESLSCSDLESWILYSEMREESQLSVKILCLVTITLCCLYAGPSAHESAQFWLWLVLVVFVIMAFIAFTVSYSWI